MVVAEQKEPLFSWRRISFFLVGLLLLFLLFSAVPRDSRRAWASSAAAASVPDTNVSHPTQFGNVSADNEDIDGLTTAQCSAEFPELYTEIERTIAFWKASGHVITAEDIQIRPEQAAMRILIHNNELRILESWHAVDPKGAAPARALGVLHLIQRAIDSAIAAGDHLPTVELALNFQDDANLGHKTHSFWTFARNGSEPAHDQLWLMPNFDFWFYSSTGSFGDAKRRAMQYDAPFASKIPKIVWRGNSQFGSELRGALIQTTLGKDWADVAHVGNHNEPAAMRTDEFCKYAMTAYTEGVTYSGRLKFLMNCNSLLFIHNTDYATHYSHLLQKDGRDQNYVGVSRDWSDLEGKVKWYLENPDAAEMVIMNSLATFRSRYTTRAAISCYIRRLIHGYSSVAFTPEVRVRMKDGEGFAPRGFSIENFLYDPLDTNLEQYNGDVGPH